MPKFMEVMLAIALIGCVWNVIALVFHVLFGANLPLIDNGMAP